MVSPFCLATVSNANLEQARYGTFTLPKMVTTQVNITPYISQYYSVFFIFLPYLKSQYYLFNLFNQIDNQ